MTASPVELPQLPPMVDTYTTDHYPEGYTAEQMRAFWDEGYRAGVRAERERCAELCEWRAQTMVNPPQGQESEWGWMHDEAEYCADAIRKGE